MRTKPGGRVRAFTGHSVTNKATTNTLTQKIQKITECVK